ncbi:Polysaccharide biosynthesis protein [Mycobacteroides abscessus subsp. abscessus]|nr:Polysaccharide biosynthesis protein [Mycobacteroides abscessus subsp. abscessus]
MGKPVRIVDLAKNLIRLSGKKEDEIGIEFMGIRPGEKLFEELLNENEIHPEQVYEKIYRGKVGSLEYKLLSDLIDGLLNKELPISELIKFANEK